MAQAGEPAPGAARSHWDEDRALHVVHVRRAPQVRQLSGRHRAPHLPGGGGGGGGGCGGGAKGAVMLQMTDVMQSSSRQAGALSRGGS